MWSIGLGQFIFVNDQSRKRQYYYKECILDGALLFNTFTPWSLVTWSRCFSIWAPVGGKLSLSAIKEIVYCHIIAFFVWCILLDILPGKQFCASFIGIHWNCMNLLHKFWTDLVQFSFNNCDCVMYSFNVNKCWAKLL